MKHFYNYDKDTKEFLSEELAYLDPAETEAEGRKIYLLPANATFVEPPIGEDGKIQVFNEDTQKWSLRTDLRGTEYYDEKTGKPGKITKIGKRLPKGMVTEAPDVDIRKPKWDGEKWVETELLFRGKKATSKARINIIVTKEIAALGEEKAKTLKMLAGDGPCPEWDAFIEARQEILDEADTFIADNKLV